MAIELDHMFLRVAEHFIYLLFDCWFRLFLNCPSPQDIGEKSYSYELKSVSLPACDYWTELAMQIFGRSTSVEDRDSLFEGQTLAMKSFTRLKEVETPVKQREQCYHATFIDYLTYIQPPPTVAKRSGATCWNLSANPWQMFFLVFFSRSTS